MTRRGLLGGTFDPIHLGHFDVARAAREAVRLDEIWLVPSAVPPHRRAPRASVADRFAMVTAAASAEPGFLVSDLDMTTTGPSYTTGTLDRLDESGVDLATVVFITGADAFHDIETWKNYPAILDRCHFAIVSRPGSPVSALRAALPGLASRMIDAPCDLPDRPAIVLVDAPTAPVSATSVRRRLAAGEPVDDLVPAAVAAYIRERGLYQ